MQVHQYHSSLHVDQDSSFWQCKDYVGIRRGSREKRLQTTVGSRVMRASIALYAEVYALCVTN